jgi:hypothetical protein
VGGWRVGAGRERTRGAAAVCTRRPRRSTPPLLPRVPSGSRPTSPHGDQAKAGAMPGTRSRRPREGRSGDARAFSLPDQKKKVCKPPKKKKNTHARTFGRGQRRRHPTGQQVATHDRRHAVGPAGPGDDVDGIARRRRGRGGRNRRRGRAGRMRVRLRLFRRGGLGHRRRLLRDERGGQHGGGRAARRRGAARAGRGGAVVGATRLRAASSRRRRGRLQGAGVHRDGGRSERACCW